MAFFQTEKDKEIERLREEREYRQATATIIFGVVLAFICILGSIAFTVQTFMQVRDIMIEVNGDR